MANHKSAEKRARTNSKRRARNRQAVSSVKTTVKKYREAVTKLGSAGQGDSTAVGELLRQAQISLTKAGQKGLIHKKTAARQVSRLTKRLAKAAAAG